MQSKKREYLNSVIWFILDLVTTNKFNYMNLLKPTLPVLFLLFFVIGCSPINYVQVFKTKPTSEITIEDDAYIFENDSLKISYDFWQEHGLLSFTVYNKLNIPLYIDWRKSSYVRNEQKLDYWNDIETTNASTEYKTYTWGGSRSYYNNGPLPGPATINSSVSNGSANTTAIKTKPERITFLAPKSKISKQQFVLFPEAGVRLSSETAKYSKLNRTDDTAKMTTLIYRDYPPDETILAFRNFLTLSTSENFANEFYVDNGFYLNRILTMDLRHFLGPNHYKYELPYADSRYFYTELSRESSLYFNSKEFKSHIK